MPSILALPPRGVARRIPWRGALTTALIVLLSGCATTSELRCRSWQMQGYLLGTLDSCAKCVDTMGSGNVEAIRGCALGLDAANLLNTNNR